MTKKNLWRLIPALTLIFVFTGCLEPPGGMDTRISEITIINIPAAFEAGPCINVRMCGQNAAVCNNTCRQITVTRVPYKIYINASNRLNSDQAAEAKGAARLSVSTLQPNGTHTVTIQLEHSNPDFDIHKFTSNPSMQNPCFPTGHWSGTAAFFSITISPQDTSEYGVNEIFVRAGFNLNSGKRIIDWKSSELVDARTSPVIGNREFIDLYQSVSSDYCCIDSMSGFQVLPGNTPGTLNFSLTAIYPDVTFHLYYARGNKTGRGAPGDIITAARVAETPAAGGVIPTTNLSGIIEGLDSGEIYSIFVVARRIGYSVRGVPRIVNVAVSNIKNVQAAE